MGATPEQRKRMAEVVRALRPKVGSRPVVADELKRRGVARVSDETVRLWENGVTAPQSGATAQILDDVLGADGAVLDALGIATNGGLPERVARLEERLKALEDRLEVTKDSSKVRQLRDTPGEQRPVAARTRSGGRKSVSDADRAAFEAEEKDLAKRRKKPAKD